MTGFSPYDLLNSFKIGSTRNIVLHKKDDEDDDACRPVCPNIGNLTYTILDDARTIDLSSLFDDCDITYTVSASPSDADSIITLQEDEKRIVVFWDTDLTPATANADSGSPGVSVY